VLDRVTRQALTIGGADVTSDDGRANATSTAYDVVGTKFRTTVTDPRGYHTVTLSDAIGRTTEIDRDGCSGGACVTITNYDAAGRLRSIADQTAGGTTTCDDGTGSKSYAGIATCFQVDGLGRKIKIIDPVVLRV
jgi:hypothetical protein